MVTKQITYTDFNGIERTENFLFNISKPEIIKWQLEEGYGLDKEVEKLTKSIDYKKSIEIFEKLLAKSYGIKSEDGKRFMKSEDITRSFVESNAYETFYMELAYNSKAASDFVNALVPKLTESERKNLEAAKAESDKKIGTVNQ